MDKKTQKQIQKLSKMLYDASDLAFDIFDSMDNPDYDPYDASSFSRFGGLLEGGAEYLKDAEEHGDYSQDYHELIDYYYNINKKHYTKPKRNII